MSRATASRHARKFGEKSSHPIPVWNGVLEHRKLIGAAIWEFLWCLDAVTVEKGEIGLVHAGAPVKVQRIAVDLQTSRKRVSENLRKLEREGYICRQRTPYGFILEVMNSCKFGIWSGRREWNKTSTHPKESGTKRPLRHGESGRFGAEEWNKPSTLIKTQQKDSAEEAVPAAASMGNDPWKILGLSGPVGSPSFQQLCLHYLATRNGNSVSEGMERTIQACQSRGVKVSPPFFEGKRVVEKRERLELGRAADEGEEITRLEAPAWGTK